MMDNVKTPEIEKEAAPTPTPRHKNVAQNAPSAGKLKLEMVKMREIKPYAKNAKLHPASQIEKIRDSILNFGYNDPIALDENNEIIEGHGRLEALKQINSDPDREIQIIRLKGMTEAQIKAYRIAHNKINLDTTFDFEILKDEFHDLEDTDYFDETGFSTEEITDIWDQPEKGLNQVVNPDEENAVEKLGSLVIPCPKCGFKIKKADN